MKVLIVGAGPAGWTTAVELARQGIVSDVIDLREGGSGLSRAVGILPASRNFINLRMKYSLKPSQMLCH